jgi:hypothetical protein
LTALTALTACNNYEERKSIENTYYR